MIYISNCVNYNKTARGSMLDVRHVSYTSVQTGWIHRDRFLTADELIFVTEGCVHLMINRECFDIRENEYLLLPKYCSISAARKSKSCCSFYSVTFETSLELSQSIGAAKRHLTGNTLFLHELLKKMVNLYNAGAQDSPECDALFLTLLYEMKSAGAESEEDTELFMQRVLDYIHENISLPLEINDLCKKFNYSRDYLSKLFRRHYDISIKSYINQAKMDTAKQLLSTSRMSVEQVGNAVGFDSVQLFYKFFRYHEQMTPSTYRKLSR